MSGAAQRVTVVSGASGFLGLALVRHLAQHGHAVRALARRPQAQPEIQGVRWHLCELPDRIDAGALAGAEVLVHCAYDLRGGDPARSRSVNVEGSRRLFDLARSRGVRRIVFVSSLSAHEQAVSDYGRSKLAVEALLDPARDVALRPGHIIGPGGIFWRQAQQIARLPFIPLFFGGRQPIQTVDLADLCEALRVLVEGELTGVHGYAEIESVQLRQLYAAVAEYAGKRPRFLPLPGGLALAALRLAEGLGFRLPVSSDNLLGLKRLRAFDLEASVRAIGVRPRTMRESLAGVPWERLATKSAS